MPISIFTGTFTNPVNGTGPRTQILGGGIIQPLKEGLPSLLGGQLFGGFLNFNLEIKVSLDQFCVSLAVGRNLPATL